MIIKKTCSVCKQDKEVRVSVSEYKALTSGAHIQDALPNHSLDDRELLISGVCGPCFDKMFEEDDDE